MNKGFAITLAIFIVSTAAAQKPRTVRRSLVVGSGEILPNRYLKLKSNLPGRIRQIYVEPGAEVAKDQALVVIEPDSRNRDNITLYSPIKGIVADIPIRVGEATSGDNSDTALITLADMSKIYVAVSIDVPNSSKVVIGQRSKIVIDAFYRSMLRGSVICKDPKPVAQSEMPEFRITIKITQVGTAIRRRLRPGMSATAWITGETRGSRKSPKTCRSLGKIPT